MNRDGRDDVADWFAWSGMKSMIPQRLHGVTPEWLLGELVRTGDARARATSLTTRTQEPDDRAPGQGEWHGATHQMVPAPVKVDPAYLEHRRRSGERARQFAQAIEEADVDPWVVYGAALQVAVDEQLCWRDRRYDGRRYRGTHTDALLDGPQAPYPIPEIDEDRYKRF
jgi:hypothetical protein